MRIFGVGHSYGGQTYAGNIKRKSVFRETGMVS